MVEDTLPLISFRDICREIELCDRYLANCRAQSQVPLEERNKRAYPTGSFLEFLAYAKMDLNTYGFQMRMPYGSIVRQPSPYRLYRGENTTDYKNTQSSLHRLLRQHTDETTFYRLHANLLLARFSNVLLKIDRVRQWNYGDVLNDALAQHYGLNTNLLDLTGDFSSALFFATTYWDKDFGRLMPITDNVIASNPKYKYGVLYFSRQILESASLLLNDLEDKKEILEIGFQPLMRCSAQSGLVRVCNDKYDLSTDPNFQKFRFKQSSLLSNFIYKKMDFGKKVFPQADNRLISDLVDNYIKQSKAFSADELKEAIKHSELEGRNRLDLVELLCQHGISVVPSAQQADYPPDEVIAEVNKALPPILDFKEFYGFELTTRLVSFH